MDFLPYIYTATVTVAAALSAIAIWSHRSMPMKVIGLSLAGLLMGLGYVSFVEMLSRPKDVDVEWAKSAIEDANVIAARLHEGRAIYVWLEIDGVQEPRAYALPWTMEGAKSLHKAMREAEQRGTGVRMHGQFETDEVSDEPLFYAEPQESLPPKTALAD